jgi:hypothetical protein
MCMSCFVHSNERNQPEEVGSLGSQASRLTIRDKKWNIGITPVNF